MTFPNEVEYVALWGMIHVHDDHPKARDWVHYYVTNILRFQADDCWCTWHLIRLLFFCLFQGRAHSLFAWQSWLYLQSFQLSWETTALNGPWFQGPKQPPNSSKSLPCKNLLIFGVIHELRHWSIHLELAKLDTWLYLVMMKFENFVLIFR